MTDEPNTCIVWKYEIPHKQCFDLNMHSGAVILSVQMQKKIPVMWALVEPENPMETRSFRCCETDESMSLSESLSHIGTFQLNDYLAFHVFEIAHKLTQPK